MIGSCYPNPISPLTQSKHSRKSGRRPPTARRRRASTPVSQVSGEDADPAPGFPLPRPGRISSVRFVVQKPSWIVRSESNIRKEKTEKPDPHCVICSGSGRVDCHQCLGRGRTNFVHLTMLPKGEWPKWCSTCGGSGLGYCNRCLGTGEYRDIMGFHFMKVGTDRS